MPIAEFIIALIVKFGPAVYDEVAKLLSHPDAPPDLHARIAEVLPTEMDAVRLRMGR